uniref:SEC7 domain-containing protein n=1 Tax=Angiostrongylus cantonensis TaxID=6313 RepID=A0A158P6M8_ANGCA
MSLSRFFTRKNVARYFAGAGVIYCVAHTIAAHVGELVICSGPSMQPTIHNGDLVLAERLSVNSGNIHRGDIVGCLSPHESNQLLCKRVVAKESDFVNSELLPNTRVPRGHVFLQGDNYLASTDSRHFGPVPAGLLQIRLTLRIWPISRFGWLSNHWFWETEEDVKRDPKDGRLADNYTTEEHGTMAVNGVYVVLGEVNTVVALLNKARRQYQLSHQLSSLDDTEPLLRNFSDLKEVLNEVANLGDMNPLTYLSPFLDVIKAQNTNGPITEAALSSVAKFLGYGLIDANSIKAANAVESVAQAVIHTKFIGGKSSGSDECVLFKILLVLRSLLLSPPGAFLSDEAICDMMQSCFRIVFEQHLSPLLRKAAEATLSDMTQLIFTRLPTFSEDARHPYMRKLVMNAKGDKRRRRRKRTEVEGDSEKDEVEVVKPTTIATIPHSLSDIPSLASTDNLIVTENTPLVKTEDVAILGYDVVSTPDHSCDGASLPSALFKQKEINTVDRSEEKADDADSEGEDDIPVMKDATTSKQLTTHEKGVTMGEEDDVESGGISVQMPYGLPCCRELLRFLISLSNPVDRKNTESMVVLGLNLLTVALEAAADHLANYSFLTPLLKDNLSRSLLQLLDTEKLPVLAATNRACFLLFESMRSQLKFQLEAYFHKLKGIVLEEQRTTNYEQKEMALESIVQLWRIPGLVTELYLNYDCDLYCSNVFEELTKLLVENAFPVSGLHAHSLISLDALLVVIDMIDQNCICRQASLGIPNLKLNSKAAAALPHPILSGFEIGQRILANESDMNTSSLERDVPRTMAKDVMPSANRHSPSHSLPSMEQVIEQKKRKRILAEGTELFNQSPKKGIEFLREKGLLGADSASVVYWLRTNPQLDKKKIADYICSRKNSNVLEAFVSSFPFENTRLDDALRMFLETFRLPGEAAEISMVMQHFSGEFLFIRWVRKNQPPMTVDCFKRNLSGTNGGADFDPNMLTSMYDAIKSEEIVMPAEQTGLVKENYLWKVLLRRGESPEGQFKHAPTGWNDHDLFSITWGPAVATLTYVFDKSEHDVILQHIDVQSRRYLQCEFFISDNIVLGLIPYFVAKRHEDENLEMQRQRGINEVIPGVQHEQIALAFGENRKAQMATKTMFQLVHANGDILREGWRNMLDCLLQLFRARLLPTELTEVDDFVDEKGWVSLIRDHLVEPQPVRSESGLLSWFGLGGSLNESERKKLTQDQQNSIKHAQMVICECRPAQLFTDSKYLTSTALSELLNALIHASQTVVEQVDSHKAGGIVSGAKEDALVFYLELIVTICLENKDRLSLVWPVIRRHLQWLLSSRFGRSPVLVERAVVGLLRIANRNLFRDNTIADDVLQSLSLLLRLSPKAMFVFSRQISFGLHELLRTNAANVHRKEHWAVLFALLEAAGAAALPDDLANSECAATSDRQAFSDGEVMSPHSQSDDRGYTSDDPKRAASVSTNTTADFDADSTASLNQSREWIHLDHRDAHQATEDALRSLGGNVAHSCGFTRSFLVLRTNLGRHEPAAFLKVCDTLSFLLRDAIHVTPDNFESCVQCLRTMVEASLDGGRYAAGPISGDAQNRLRSHVEDRVKKTKTSKPGKVGGKKELSTDVGGDLSEMRQEEQQLTASYQQVSLQLLDLCSTLHNLAPGILAQWAKTQSNVDASVPFVWRTIWRPLLQAMARLGCDCRRLVRAAALTHLQRAFLPSNMANLGAAEWESCFGDVLFPLLGKLLDVFSAMDPIGMEDTRVRAMQIVAKTLLNHLTALSTLPSFPSLWLRLLDFMDNYLRVDSCGNLNEAIPESLKNMLLVMASTGLFSSIPGLHQMTVSRMGNVLPQLIRETLPEIPPSTTPAPEPKSLTLVASVGRIGGSRVQIAPAIPSSPEVSSELVTSPLITLSSTTSLATITLPSSAVNTIDLTEHVATTTAPMNVTPELAPVPTATEPVNIPELTEVVVYSAAASPKTPPSPAIESQLYSFTSQGNLVTSAGEVVGSVSQTMAHVPLLFHAHPPCDELQQPQYQQHCQEAVANPSGSAPVSQTQYYSQPCQQYSSYMTSYHSTAPTAYSQNPLYVQQQHQLYKQHANPLQAVDTSGKDQRVSFHVLNFFVILCEDGYLIATL